MSVNNGFGSYSTSVNSTNNPTLVVQLPTNETKRILDIHAMYSLRTGAANTALEQGRLLIVGVKYGSPVEAFDPRNFEVPESLSGAKIYFDAPLGRDELDALTISRSFNFNNGIIIPEGVDCSVILTQCIGDGAAYPICGEVNAFLTVNGVSGKSEKIFKNV
jgi:hypothetical protein